MKEKFWTFDKDNIDELYETKDLEHRLIYFPLEEMLRIHNLAYKFDYSFDMIPTKQEKEFEKFYKYFKKWFIKKDQDHSQLQKLNLKCNPQQTSQETEQLPPHNQLLNSQDYQINDRDILSKIRQNLKRSDKSELEAQKLHSIMFRDWKQYSRSVHVRLEKLPETNPQCLKDGPKHKIMLDTTEQRELNRLARELIAGQLRELYLLNENETDRNYLILNNGHSKKLKIHLTKDHLVKLVREGLLNVQQKILPEEAVKQEIRKIHLPQAEDPFDENAENQVKKIDKSMNAIKWRKFDVFIPFYIEHWMIFLNGLKIIFTVGNSGWKKPK
jgi:hypothetical protein